MRPVRAGPLFWPRLAAHRLHGIDLGCSRRMSDRPGRIHAACTGVPPDEGSLAIAERPLGSSRVRSRTHHRPSLRMPETLTALFWDRVETAPTSTRSWSNADGRWHRLAWRDVGTIVRELALGLLALGRRPGDAVAILAASRAEWVHADFAILSARGVTIPIYATYAPEQIAYILDDAAARTVVVENAAQLAAVRAAPIKLTSLDTIIVIEGVERGEPGVLSWDAVRQLGRRHAARSGEHARRPGGVDWSRRHRNDRLHVRHDGCPERRRADPREPHGGAARRRADPGRGGRRYTSCSSLWPIRSLGSKPSWACTAGSSRPFAESLQAVSANLREVRPHLIFAVPRVFEKAHAQVLAAVEQRPLRRAEGLRVGHADRTRSLAPAAGRTAGVAPPDRGARPCASSRVQSAARAIRRSAPVRRLWRCAALAGDCRVLPRRGHPGSRRLRPHRSLSRAHLQPDRPLQVRLGGAGSVPGWR
jgi:hypothetical protein